MKKSKSVVILTIKILLAFSLGYLISFFSQNNQHEKLRESLIELRDIHKRQFESIHEIKERSSSNQRLLLLLLDKEVSISCDSLKEFLIEDAKLHSMTSGFISDIQSLIYTDSMFIELIDDK